MIINIDKYTAKTQVEAEMPDTDHCLQLLTCSRINPFCFQLKGHWSRNNRHDEKLCCGSKKDDQYSILLKEIAFSDSEYAKHQKNVGICQEYAKNKLIVAAMLSYKIIFLLNASGKRESDLSRGMFCQIKHFLSKCSLQYTDLITFRIFLFKLLFSEVGGGCKIRSRRSTVMPVEASSIPKIYLLRQMKSESVDPSEMF